MMPSTHTIFGGIFSIILLVLFPSITWWQALIVFLSSVLIDVDHYLLYVYLKKDWSLKRAYQYYVIRVLPWRNLSKKEKASYKLGLIIFHGIEFWAVLILLIFLNKIFFFVFLGIFLHMILDFIDLYRWKEPYYQKVSQILVYQRNKKKKNYSV